MTYQDFIITPIWFLLLLFGAYMIRPFATNRQTRPYFIPGLLVKFVGAIALGLIYQFYYEGGDTFTFHTHGSQWIWKAFMDDPTVGLQFFFQKAGDFNGQTFKYTSQIWQYRDPASWFLIRITAFFDIFTFSTYGATALFFASFAFSGAWALFNAFYKIYPKKTKSIAIVTLFVPSVIFWGSGLLKDSITLGSLGWLTYSLFEITTHRKVSPFNLLSFLFFSWIIFSIKIYILLSFLVATSAFLIFQYGAFIKNPLVKILATPFIAVIFILLGYFALQKISADDSRYSLDKIAETAIVTAYDIRYGWGARNGENSGYDLGIPDGSISSFIYLVPKGIIVTLFRPWPWEARNPLMIFAALESTIIFFFSIKIFFTSRLKTTLNFIQTPIGVFCLTFSLTFAFAVGVSTANFGTLMRYKIPVMPFYLTALSLLYSKK